MLFGRMSVKENQFIAIIVVNPYCNRMSLAPTAVNIRQNHWWSSVKANPSISVQHAAWILP